MSYEHECKYFIFKVSGDFEPVDMNRVVYNEPYVTESKVQLYQRTEYAILGCACGQVIKRKIKQDDTDN